jgi:hypothetical protein
MTTLRRTAKTTAAKIMGSDTCTRYDLDSNFIGQPSEPKFALAGAQGRYSRVYQAENGKVVVYVHGNLWYVLS